MSSIAYIVLQVVVAEGRSTRSFCMVENLSACNNAPNDSKRPLCDLNDPHIVRSIHHPFSFEHTLLPDPKLVSLKTIVSPMAS